MHSVVVLNSNYEYNGDVTMKKVLKWLVKDKIEVVAEKEDEKIHSVNSDMKMPMVVRLPHFMGYKIKSDIVQYSDEAVYRRDKNICQYWHNYTLDEAGKIVWVEKPYQYRCTETDHTIDHVIPKARGGKTSFYNCVCCCRTCNELLKRNMTPEEAGLRILRKPSLPVVRKGEFAIFMFSFNPNKIAHQYYMDRVLRKKFSSVV